MTIAGRVCVYYLRGQLVAVCLCVCVRARGVYVSYLRGPLERASLSWVVGQEVTPPGTDPIQPISVSTPCGVHARLSQSLAP